MTAIGLLFAAVIIWLAYLTLKTHSLKAAVDTAVDDAKEVANDALNEARSLLTRAKKL